MVAVRCYWRDPLTWSCNLGIFVFGVVLAMLGAILPSLFEAVRLDPAEAGSLFLLLNLGALLATVPSGPASDRFGFRLILSGCSLLVGAGILIIAAAESYPALGLGSLVLGLGGGGLNVGTNALVSDLYPEGRAAALHRLVVFFGLGTFCIPRGAKLKFARGEFGAEEARLDFLFINRPDPKARA